VLDAVDLQPTAVKELDMRRRHIHIGFAVTTAILASLAGYEAWQLNRAKQVNAAIANPQAAMGSSMPHSRFAQANLLVAQGEYEAAVAAYKELTQSEDRTLKSAAYFNLGNAHLREALEHGPQDETRWLPMIEFAKQSYRAVLRENPSNWDARYNLEHALRLAPEVEESATTDKGPPPDSERTTSTISSSRMDLP
jgi:mxaK protein